MYLSCVEINGRTEGRTDLSFVGATTTGSNESSLVDFAELGRVQLATLATFRALVPWNVLDQLARSQVPQLQLVVGSPRPWFIRKQSKRQTNSFKPPPQQRQNEKQETRDKKQEQT